MIISYDDAAAEVAQALAASGARPVPVAGLSVVASEDFEAYAEGRITSPRCVLCGGRPCECPPFGSDEYLDLVYRLHGKRGN